MARTATQMPRQGLPVEWDAFLHTAMAPFRGARPAAAFLLRGDDAVARALACAGLGALFLLPALLLLSVVLGAPLAVPAIIALGFLVSSHALATQRPGRAAIINAAVLVGLVAWSLVSLQVGEDVSRPGLAAALLAPLFAAMPACARLAMAPRRDAAARAALRSADCLNRLAPSEAVLVVRRDGTLLAATSRASAILRLPADAAGRDVTRHFGLVDRPRLCDAICQSAHGGEPIAVTLQDASWSAGRTATVDVAAMEAGAVSVRLAGAPDAAPATRAESRATSAARIRTEAAAGEGPVSDLGEAASFAVHRAEAQARSQQVALAFDMGSGVAVRAERQRCRRVASTMIESALARCRPGDTLHLTARALKSVALLRIELEPAASDRDANADAGFDFASLTQLLDDVGGTAVAETTAAGARLSVRLQLATSPS